MGIGNGKEGVATRLTGERMYPFPMPELGIQAHSQDVVQRHLQRYVQAVAEVTVRRGIGGDWLDIACGSGYGSSVVKKAGADSYHGVDYDETAVTYARQIFGQNGTFEHADARAWAKKELAEHYVETGEEEKWDAILCVETLEHLPKEAQLTFLIHLVTGLRRDGVLVITCPLGDGVSKSPNPYHLYEPTQRDLVWYLGSGLDSLYTEEVEGTFGSFRQVYVVFRWR